MKKNILLVVNPISGDVDKLELIDATTIFAGNQNLNLVIYNTSGTSDIENIKALYNTYLPERIIVAGGDGTIKMVAEAMETHDVVIGILPAGSANGLAVDLNLPTTTEENLEIAFLNDYMEIDMISINGKKSIHLSDLGVNAELIKNYESGSIRGKWGYALQTVSTLIDLDDPFIATITGDFPTIECEARMIVIANSQKYGTGVSINPNGVMDDGKFELVILKNMDLLVLGKIITGNMPVDNIDVEIISTNKAVVTTNIPVSFQIDGEYCGKETKLDIHILPKQMKVAVSKIK
ncbi:diacylglycerol/lipid kinase family protein [Flavobacterium glaciei]|uniref:Diacylglycerol kinase family enzyme n=1 Tax=Flavobacterium glaciei TaxID=386300 RepID=A0A562PL64_9FLAO|nr:diacylglycerol kinase family protein [Flavobacterium glaciei]RDI51395.1 diacylglycerol kinase family enzyme [Flavobacterium glaciei]TWI45118.1 diacylglycerol kinase family enzyme [Flavobacterium glaciei]